MKSHGPYKIYDHSSVKGSSKILKEANDLAQKRFKQELKSIKNLREFERSQFYDSKKNQDDIAAFKAKFWRQNHDHNFEFIQKQIEYKDQK